MDSKKNKRDIPTILINLIENMSDNKDLTGKQKKDIVMRNMIETFNMDVDMVIMVSDFIDLIIKVHKHKTKIKTNTKKILKLCC
jgi:hypothetical protein